MGSPFFADWEWLLEVGGPPTPQLCGVERRGAVEIRYQNRDDQGKAKEEGESESPEGGQEITGPDGSTESQAGTGRGGAGVGVHPGPPRVGRSFGAPTARTPQAHSGDGHCPQDTSGCNSECRSGPGRQRRKTVPLGVGSRGRCRWEWEEGQRSPAGSQT